MVDELMDANRNMSYPEQEILNAAVQEYKVDAQYQLDPVGIQCAHLEGNFLNILGRKAFYRNLNKCFDNAGIAIAEMFLAPLALADNVLTEAEKRAGCLLVDLGADTTTVSVFYKNILRHLAVIPLGGSNITKDIESLQIEDTSAESMKLKYGSAYTDNADIDNTLMFPIDEDRSVESRKFIEIVEGRIEEIIENIWFQVPNEFVDKLLGGIILTGGGSNMKNIELAFRKHTHIDKIRIAKFGSLTINSTDPIITNHDGTMNTVLGLLDKGNMNCAGVEITSDLFSTGEHAKPTVTTAELHKNPRPFNETIGSGVVQTEAERQAEEELRRKKEAEEAAQRQAEEERARKEAEERRKNSRVHKALKGLKGFLKKMTEEEE
jgi:cell division protein FtsA